MPRMSKKSRIEWSMFLNERGRKTYSEICVKCVNGCKQTFRSKVIDCRDYRSKRSKAARPGTEAKTGKNSSGIMEKALKCHAAAHRTDEAEKTA